MKPASLILQLTWSNSNVSDTNFRKIARFLGVKVDRVPVFRTDAAIQAFKENLFKYSCVVLHYRTLENLLQRGLVREDLWDGLFTRLNYLFIYGCVSSESSEDTLDFVTLGALAGMRKPSGSHLRYDINADRQEFCGHFAGISFGPAKHHSDHVFVQGHNPQFFTVLIGIQDDPFFVELRRSHCRVFLVGSEVADIDERVRPGVSIKSYFSELVPSIMLIRFVCGESCWSPKQFCASLIIDDPLLRDQYGFLNYRSLLQRMDKHNFATSIAFIPWNCRRSKESTSQIFRERKDRYTLSIHGCDHTAHEFGTQQPDEVNSRISRALARMRLHEHLSGIPFDDVMVFPQGFFSTTAMNVLKANGLLAAVNTSPYSVDEIRGGLMLRDFMGVAIMTYSSFPLFVRHYPDDFVEYVFDLFLGRPLLIVEHHDYLKDGGVRLVELVDRINSLEPTINWASLQEIISHSYLQREVSQGNFEVQFYAPRVEIQNKLDRSTQYLVWKKESESSDVAQVIANGNTVPYKLEDGILRVSLTLEAFERIGIVVRYKGIASKNPIELGWGYESKVYVRRFLCELRDNWLSKNPNLLHLVQRLREKVSNF